MLTPDDAANADRWAYTRLVGNILGGTWEMEIQDRMREQYGLTNVQNMGRPSMAVNLCANYVDQIAVIYQTPSVVTNPLLTPDASACWSAIVEGCHLWQLEQEQNRRVVGLRESFYLVVPTPSGIQLEIVSPAEIVVLKTTGDASCPTALKRAITVSYTDKEGKPAQRDCWETWDVSDPAKPVHTVTASDGEDFSERAYPGSTATGYAFTDDEGPFLPWVLYRARYTGDTFDPYYGSELVHGTLDIAIHWTMWGVCLRNNSWPQWWLMDADVPGTSTADSTNGMLSNPPETIELAPNSILRFKSTGAGNGKVGQLQPADAKTMGDAILTKQNTILNNVGIHPDDLSTTGGPQSGVAIQLKRSAQRKAAIGYVPMFRDGDLRLFKTMARVHNVFYARSAAEPGLTDDGTEMPGVTAVPELPVDGWRIDYELPEMSTDEFLADLSKDADLIDMGLKSLIDLAMKYYDVETPAEAMAKLDEVKRMSTLYPVDPAKIAAIGANTSRRSGTPT